MRFFVIAMLSLWFVAVSACPPDDEQTSKISKPMGEKFNKGQNLCTAIGGD
jgi:hypothetical protein